MRPPEQVKVRFEEPAGLSAFCEELRDHHIPYLLIGSNTVVLATHDFARTQQLKLGALKDNVWHQEYATPLNKLSDKAQSEVARWRLIPTSKLLENLRTRLANFR